MTTPPESATSLCLDQQRRWLCGDRVSVEAYLAERRSLGDKPDAVLDLIYNEIVLRERSGEHPALADYVRRFPEFAEQLRLQFNVHRIIEDSVLSSAPLASDTGEESAGDVKTGSLPDYEILDELGRGGMGIVYRARQRSLNRLVALKMIGTQASPQLVARFRTEAAAVARLQHPNIVQVHDVGEQRGVPYLALELVAGASLDKVIAGQPAPPEAAARLVETLARAMHYVHQQGILHRDLKPANVLMQIVEHGMDNDGGAGCAWRSAIPKISDFGLAKLLDDDSGRITRTMVGTPSYMAPEQTMEPGKPIGPAADVYALGAILYELLTGRPPFDGKSVLEILEQVRAHDPAPTTRWQAGVPSDLDTICLKCLRKEPSQRYASALDLAEDLRRALAHEPIQARPVGPIECTLKWCRRHPPRVGILAVTGTALVLLALLNVRHWSGLQEARNAYQAFTKHRADALFHWRATTNPEATKVAVAEALAIVDLNDADLSAPILNPYWSEREKEEVRAGCSQLFFVLADAAAYRSPQRSDDTHRARVRDALAILDRAAQLLPPSHVYHLRRARYLKWLGDKPGTRLEEERAARTPPTSAVDFLLLGDEWYERGEIQEAAQYFQQALLRAPNDFWAQYGQAVCQVNLKRHREAEAGLSKCLTERPDFAWARYWRGLAHGELGDDVAAERDFEAVLQAQPGTVVQYVVLNARGVLHIRRRQFEAADADLQAAIALKPKLFPAHVNLAELHQARNDLKRANRQLEHALQLDLPNAVAAHCQVERSRNLYIDKQFVDALAAADAALRIAPLHAEAHQRRGFALLGIKLAKDAVESLNEFVKHGGRPGADFFRARGGARMRLGDYLGAKDDYTDALKIDPQPELYVHRGWAYFFADAWKPALHDFDQAIRLDAGGGDAYTGRGLCRAMLGQADEAAADAEEALQRKPATPEMMHNIACTFAQALRYAHTQAAADGWRDQALNAITQTLAMVPEADRRVFWRDKIRPDTALDSVRDHAKFIMLDTRYGSD